MRKVKCPVCILFLLIVVRAIYSEEPRLNIWNTRPCSELLNQPCEQLIEKIKFLKSRGYWLSQKSPSFFSEQVYYMVYSEINDLGRIVYVNIENDIIYHFVYALNKPDDPNYLTIAFFKIDDTIYWFFKTNFFLEYETERTFTKSDGSVRTLKIFL